MPAAGSWPPARAAVWAVLWFGLRFPCQAVRPRSYRLPPPGRQPRVTGRAHTAGPASRSTDSRWRDHSLQRRPAPPGTIVITLRGPAAGLGPRGPDRRAASPPCLRLTLGLGLVVVVAVVVVVLIGVVAVVVVVLVLVVLVVVVLRLTGPAGRFLAPPPGRPPNPQKPGAHRLLIGVLGFLARPAACTAQRVRALLKSVAERVDPVARRLLRHRHAGVDDLAAKVSGELVQRVAQWGLALQVLWTDGEFAASRRHERQEDRQPGLVTPPQDVAPDDGDGYLTSALHPLSPLHGPEPAAPGDRGGKRSSRPWAPKADGRATAADR